MFQILSNKTPVSKSDVKIALPEKVKIISPTLHRSFRLTRGFSEKVGSRNHRKFRDDAMTEVMAEKKKRLKSSPEAAQEEAASSMYSMLVDPNLI